MLHTCYCFLDRVYVDNRVEKTSGELGCGSLFNYYLVEELNSKLKCVYT